MSSAHELADLLRLHGARATPARLRVLGLLQASVRSLSQHEVEAALGGEFPIDRVTVYRVLNWLVRKGFVLRTADAKRTFRFAFCGTLREKDGASGRFVCVRCGRQYTLAEECGPELGPREGFVIARMEILVHGYCAHCNGFADPEP